MIEGMGKKAENACERCFLNGGGGVVPRLPRLFEGRLENCGGWGQDLVS